MMNIGIAGLGLIGGSFARALKQNTKHRIFGYDIQESIFLQAKLVGAVDDRLNEDTLSSCDLVIVALRPQDTVDYICEHAGQFRPGAAVLDCCGVKRYVCQRLRAVAEEHGFVFLGGHPMAGTTAGGFAASRPTLFVHAAMVLTPFPGTDLMLLSMVRDVCRSIGFTTIRIATPEEHDEMIAYTSQLAHVVSSAYVRSELAPRFKGFSAGSFRDMTRVARLNEAMWTELFLENKDFLTTELDHLIERLKEYSNALKKEDSETVCRLLREGRERREELD